MDFTKSKVLLKKINTLHESADSFNHQFSSLEKDLILQYLRELYEIVSGAEVKKESRRKDRETPKNKTEKIAKVPEPPISTHYTRTPEHVVESVANGHFNDDAQNSQRLPSENKKQASMLELDPEIEKLFGESQAQNSSNRFANRPIKDIAKVMGINERILTINELFDGDQRLFNQVTEKLSSLSTYEEAKEYLAHQVAVPHNWLNKKKREKAEIFLNLVKRRFS